MSGSSSSKTYTQDPAYNARMARVAERQQLIADKYFAFWQQNQAPLEKAQAKANLSLIPLQTKLEKNTLAAQNELLPMETELAKNDMQMQLNISDDKFALAEKHMQKSSEFLDAAGKINEDERAATAAADVSGQFSLARRELERTSDPYRSGSARTMLANEEALAKAGASTQARREAEMDKVNVLNAGLQNSFRTLGG